MELNEFFRKVFLITILIFIALFFVSCGQAVGGSKEICVNKESGRFEFTEKAGYFAIDACNGGTHRFSMPDRGEYL